MHDFYLVQWLITLFANTLPRKMLDTVWTYLFTERVDFLFFICLGILKQLQTRLLALDLNQTLQTINNIKHLIDGPCLVRDSLFFMQNTPVSFIANDLIMPDTSDDLEALKQNEFFAKRWWELARLDYNKSVQLCMITCDDL